MQTHAAHALVAHTCAGYHVSDAELLSAVTESLNSATNACCGQDMQALALVETAGGPASPGPSGTLQVRRACPTPLCPSPLLRPCPPCAPAPPGAPCPSPPPPAPLISLSLPPLDMLNNCACIP